MSHEVSHEGVLIVSTLRWNNPRPGWRHSSSQTAAVWQQQESELQRDPTGLRRARVSLHLLPTSPGLQYPGEGPLVLGGERARGRRPLEGGAVRESDGKERPEGQLPSGIQQLLLVPGMWQKEAGGASQQRIDPSKDGWPSNARRVPRLRGWQLVIFQRVTRGQSCFVALLQAQLFQPSVPSLFCF